MRKPIVLAAALALLGMAACKTDTTAQRVDDDNFVVRDVGDGANPEKGLLDTCPRIGRTIATYTKVKGSANGDQLIVTCGEKAPR